MAVEDDPAWERWNSCHKNMKQAELEFSELRHRPITDERRQKALGKLRLAIAALNDAANEIEPRFKC